MLVAVDTNVLFDFALGSEAVADAIETLKDRIPALRLVVPPTVLHELAFAIKSAELEKRKVALCALSQLRTWDLEPVNLIPVGHGIVERIADTLRKNDLIPAVERNDSLIIAEAALLGCGILLTADQHMRGIDPQSLNLLLRDFHLAAPIVAAPREIVTKFYR